jgi:membrane-bound lytic murein transglycosylase D
MLLAAFAPAAAPAAEEPAQPAATASHHFPRPAALEPQVRFWRSIFTEYSGHQVVLHDAFQLDKIYKVLDFRSAVEEGLDPDDVARLRDSETEMELARLEGTLRRLPSLLGTPDAMTAEERRIYTLFADDPAPDRFLAAAADNRLRSQRGLRERFGDGVRVSRRYLPEMERIFRAEGLPVELTRLPLIESCFNIQAYSKAGAAGIWQFMPKTGRLFMRVDHLVDERRDPLASTRAAAQFLAQNHDVLGSWPLAITAYNHGPYGIARAVDELGTSDIATIIRDYRGSSFGFASRNFYAEFLAALEVERDHRKYFGEMPVEASEPVREHRLDRALGIAQAARLADTDRDRLAELNPALTGIVVEGRRPIPAGYRLRLPAAEAEGFQARLAELPEPRVVRVAARPVRKARTPARATYVTHRVRPGQTLSHIAKKHGVSVNALRSANRIGKSTRLRAGQTLRIPVSANAA